MDDVGFGDSEEENLEVEEQKEKATLTMDKSVTKNSSSLGLPMNEASEAWMDDVGDGVSFDDSEEEILEVEIPERKTADTNDKVIIEAFDDLETDVVGNAAGFYTSKEPKEKPQKYTALAKLSQSVIEKNLSLDSFWLNKIQIDEAEKNYYEMKAKLKIDPIKIHKQDDPDNDDSDSSGKKNKENPDEEGREQEEKENSSYLPDLEESDFSWNDESTYLKPNIPVLKPVTFKMTSLHQSVQVESSVSKSAKCLSLIIKDSVEKSNSLSLDNQVSPLKVSLENLQSSTDNLEETLQNLSSEDLDSQFALVQFTLKTIGDLESEANRIENELMEEKNTEIDFVTLSANLTSCKTKLVTLRTKAENIHSKIKRYRDERRKRLNEIKRYQTLLIDLEHWLGEAQSTISTDIKLTTVKIVRDQIRASEVLALELKSRSLQLEEMIREIDNLVSYTDVEPLVADMKNNLTTLLKVMEEAQQCLDLKLENLQVA